MEPYTPRPVEKGLPYVVAHRGISGKAPENTLASFSRAIAIRGINMIELDVRISKDNEIIVLHDKTLQRTSTGNGLARTYTVEELKRFDAGSWFHSSFASERIPLLREVLHLVQTHCWVNIEMKSDFLFRPQEGFVKRVIETVQELEMDRSVLYSSFTHDLVARVRRIVPKATTAVIYNLYRDFGRLPSKLCERVGASVFVCAKHELRKSMIEDAHRHGLALYVYTLNDVQDVKKMQDLGVDGIISDNADEIAKTFDKDM